jgi:hypothetical protein
MNGVTSKSYFTALNIIYFAIMTVMIAFSAVAFVAGAQADDPALAENFKIAVPVAVIVFYTTSHFVYKAQVQQIARTEGLKNKMSKYQGAVLIRAAPIEAAGLFGAVATLLTGKFYFLGAPALSAIIFMLQRPTVYSVVQDLSLAPDDKSRLENPNEIVAERQTPAR